MATEFIDKARISVSAGKGGNGAVAFHREKYIAAGGPDGGDGGNGGDIILQVDDNMSTLMDFRYKRKYTAENGMDGQGRRKFGKSGKPLTIRVPRGTLVRDAETNEIIQDMSSSEPYVLCRGGKGGWGNCHFATPTRQVPRFAKAGLPGESHDVILELKLLADVGLIGFPNVGKSTLLSVVSKARPKIANYHFTTLYPNLGVVYVDEGVSFVMADIPGIIEGAADGAGLGLGGGDDLGRTLLGGADDLGLAHEDAGALFCLLDDGLCLRVGRLDELGAVADDGLGLAQLYGEVCADVIEIVPNLFHIHDALAARKGHSGALFQQIFDGIQKLVDVHHASPSSSAASAMGLTYFQSRTLPYLYCFFSCKPPTSAGRTSFVSLSQMTMPPGATHLSTMGRIFSSVPLWKGGSSSTRSNCSRQAERKRAASPMLTRLRSKTPQFLQFFITMFTASRFSSRNTHRAAPRLRASMPSWPLPA